MNRWRLFFTGISFGIVCACAPQQGVTTTPTARTAAAIQEAKLPCAEINNTTSPIIRYPAESIYRNAAVLPKQEGLVCLEELASWLKSVPQNHWQVTVAGEEGYGFDPLELAAKRQELLQRFFTRKGLEQQDWEWQTVVAQGEQLELRSLSDNP